MASSSNKPASSSRTDRKTIEKNRRNQMKALYCELNSLVPHQRSREAVSLPGQLEEAAKYIKKLQINLEKMKEKKDSLMGEDNPRNMSSSTIGMMATTDGPNLPHIEIREIGSALEITLITGLDCQFMFNQAIRLIHEGGAEIVNASFSVVDDKVFHTIHSKMEEEAGTAGYGAARISESLKKFVHDAIASRTL